MDMVPIHSGPTAVDILAEQFNVGINRAFAPNVEIMIPGAKVGLIIGKGGETIKNLQERSGTRMVVVQNGAQQQNEKPLHIFGDPHNVEQAKQLVYDLIAEKSGPQQTIEVAVPLSAVGAVIGKKGKMINKIQNETGARVRFRQDQDDNADERMCTLTGTMIQMEEARKRIEELVGSVLTRNCCTGPARGIAMLSNGQEKIEYKILVPSIKTGFVIGRGGLTIKRINQQSGALCELDRRPSADENESIFIIRGSPDQVELAKTMISEKLGVDCVRSSQEPMAAPSIHYPLGENQNSTAYAAPAWTTAVMYPQHWSSQLNDPSRTDPNAAAAAAAAWTAYYQQQSYFQQPTSGASYRQPEGNSGNVLGNPQTGYTDYLAQYIQYYQMLEANNRMASTTDPGAPEAAEYSHNE